MTNARAGNKLKISADFSSDADVSGSRKKFTHLGQTNGGGETAEQHRTFYHLAGWPC